MAPNAQPATPHLLGLPRRPLTPQQQIEALRKVQNQAEQRVKLGMQLFKAAETRVGEQREVLTAIKAHQKEVQDHVNTDVAKTLQQYDQWMGQFDEKLTKAMQHLEQRFNHLETNVEKSQKKISTMMSRAETMLEQTRLMLAQAERKTAAPPPESPESPQPPKRQGPTVVDQAQAKAKRQPPIKPKDDSKPAGYANPTSENPKSPPLKRSDSDRSPMDEKIYSQLLRRLRQPPESQPPESPQDPGQAA